MLGGLQTVTGAEAADCGEPRQATPKADDFEMVTIDDDTESPMELAVADDGRVFYVERITGEINVYNPANGQVTTAGTIPVSSVPGERLIGIQLTPDFDTTNQLYVAYTPLPDTEQRVARVALHGRREQHDRPCAPSRSSSSGRRQRDRVLPLRRLARLRARTATSTSPPATTRTRSPPTASRRSTSGPAAQFWDAQRTSANTNNHNGKILRIHPLPGATGAPGVGTTTRSRAATCSRRARRKTLPEIYAMGFRNPFRITVDPHTGWVLVGDYGPDAGATNPNRGPQGSVEFEVVKQPGFYGWPYCVRDNVPYNDYNFANSTSGPKFNCAEPVNNSPNNTGLHEPAAGRSRRRCGSATPRPTRAFPALGTGGAPTGGPRYEYDPSLDSPTKFPEYYDEHWFIGEWNNGWIRTATLDANGDALGVVSRPRGRTTFLRPHEIEFGPDGSLYVIDWGTASTATTPTPASTGSTTSPGDRRPIAQATATPDNGPAPLDRAVLQRRLDRPRGHAR